MFLSKSACIKFKLYISSVHAFQAQAYWKNAPVEKCLQNDMMLLLAHFTKLSVWNIQWVVQKCVQFYPKQMWIWQHFFFPVTGAKRIILYCVSKCRTTCTEPSPKPNRWCWQKQTLDKKCICWSNHSSTGLCALLSGVSCDSHQMLHISGEMLYRANLLCQKWYIWSWFCDANVKKYQFTNHAYLELCKKLCKNVQSILYPCNLNLGEKE